MYLSDLLLMTSGVALSLAILKLSRALIRQEEELFKTRKRLYTLEGILFKQGFISVKSENEVEE